MAEITMSLFISYLPHTTHLLQPLDRAVFSSFKTSYFTLIKQLQMNKSISRYDLAGLVNKTWVTIKKESIINGFEVTGIHPFNRCAIKLEQMKPSTLNDIYDDPSTVSMSSSSLP